MRIEILNMSKQEDVLRLAKYLKLNISNLNYKQIVRFVSWITR